jgi:hypothetical protein
MKSLTLQQSCHSGSCNARSRPSTRARCSSLSRPRPHASSVLSAMSMATASPCSSMFGDLQWWCASTALGRQTGCLLHVMLLTRTNCDRDGMMHAGIIKASSFWAGSCIRCSKACKQCTCRWHTSAHTKICRPPSPNLSAADTSTCRTAAQHGCAPNSPPPPHT